MDSRTGRMAPAAQGPAVVAWRRLRPEDHGPVRVDALRQPTPRFPHRGVYRLWIGDRGDAPVIAKHVARDDLEHERTLYERLLPRLPLSRVDYLGAVLEDDRASGWLFLSDAGADPYSPRNPAHRVRASAWLAVLHSHAPEWVSGVELPDRGIAWYAERLAAARAKTDEALATMTLTQEERATLGRLRAWCDRASERWPELAERAGGLPRSLVHADFVGENVRVQGRGADLILLPFDWGTAGWGVPARDLVGLDLEVYHRTVRERWPAVTLADVRSVANLGKRFRLIAAIHRSLLSLPWAPVEKVVSDIRFLVARA